MKFELTKWMSEPLYAGGIAAVIGIFAKYMDNRMSETKGTIMGYLKSAMFSAVIVAFWVWFMNRGSSSDSGGGGGSGKSDYYTSRYASRHSGGGSSGMRSGGYSGVSRSGYSGGGSGGYSGGGSGGYSGGGGYFGGDY